MSKKHAKVIKLRGVGMILINKLQESAAPSSRINVSHGPALPIAKYLLTIAKNASKLSPIVISSHFWSFSSKTFTKK